MVIDDNDVITDLLLLSDVNKVAESTYIQWAEHAQEQLDELRPGGNFTIPRYEELPAYARNTWNSVVEIAFDLAMFRNDILGDVNDS